MRIRTNDAELYSKLKSLNYTDEVVIKKSKNASKIIRNINKAGGKVESEPIGDRLLLRLLGPMNLNIYKTRRR